MLYKGGDQLHIRIVQSLVSDMVGNLEVRFSREAAHYGNTHISKTRLTCASNILLKIGKYGLVF